MKDKMERPDQWYLDALDHKERANIVVACIIVGIKLAFYAAIFAAAVAVAWHFL